MRKKVIGVTVGTPLKPSKIEEEIKPIKTVNGIAPDENGNVEIKGAGGENGKTPYIKDGNWWIGDTDTGVKAKGTDGKDGINGTGLYRGTVVFDEDSASSDETEIVETIDKPNGEPFIVGDMVIETNGKIWRIFDNKGHVTLVTSTKGEKGDKGDKGEQGIQGEKGEKGDKGADGTTQVVPLFANSIAECTDTTKLYVLPDGYIYAYIKTKIWQEGSTNLIPASTVSGGGSIYDGDGYKLGVRLNSTATEKEQLWCITTGFIPITKNDVLRIKYWANGKSDYFTQTGNSICLYNSSYTHLTTNQEGIGLNLSHNGIGAFDSSTEIYTVKISDILNNDDIAFVRISTLVTTVGQTATDADATKVIVTVNEEIADGYYVESYGWASTGHAFVPTDYEDRIIELEDGLEAQEARLTSLEINGGNNVPIYWLEELATKANAIQVAMEKAGRNKSAFLWYTDAHWVNGNSKVSPYLLNYLYMNTPMNKVNFGGDIIGDSLLATREEMKYLYEWRKAIKDLPNHHSVLGNHDNFASDNVDYEGDNFTYSWLIAPEESADMVMGGDFYYYIDNPCEKTRYLYLDSGRRSLSDDEVAFVIDALTTTPNGWHIVAISHIWWLYESSSAPTVGGIAWYCRQILNVFDAYNARQSGSVTMNTVTHSYNFTACGGKVEFCIGGHIHVDYDIASTGGIPIIITTSDTNQNRVPDSTIDCGTLGTITEAAVYGIVADYNNKKITVVGVGRGGSREITY